MESERLRKRAAPLSQGERERESREQVRLQVKSRGEGVGFIPPPEVIPLGYPEGLKGIKSGHYPRGQSRCGSEA